MIPRHEFWILPLDEGVLVHDQDVGDLLYELFLRNSFLLEGSSEYRC